ncbi:MAG: 3-phosphoshikimate 1-carboxyvinyltransferase [Bacillota bacterium]|nr:3-phosphoshikimate 1-carboxyvinyltransferase [Bacillota bacterium]
MIIHEASSVRGTLTVPGDKSISHRAVMLGAIADGTTHIKGFLNGEDCMSTISCFHKLGVKINIDGTDVVVEGVGLNGLKPSSDALDIGNSGTTARILTGILAGQPFDSIIDGDDSIRRRPMGRVIVPLSELGANIKSSGGKCPLHISASSLHGGEIVIPVASAQLKSAVLMAGLYASGKTTVTEPAKSRDHTELMLKAFGADIQSDGASVTVSHSAGLKAIDINVPGDISSAAFFIVAALILPDSEVTIKNVGINETRTGIIDALREMGADITYSNINGDVEPSADITVRHSELHGITIGGDIIPRMIDEVPIFAVAALFANGETVIRDAGELKVKESDRIAAIVNEFCKCGADIKKTDDGMIIRGGKKLKASDFDSYKDHRMAMSEAVLSLTLPGESSIKDAEAVSISYPGFYNDLNSIRN